MKHSGAENYGIFFIRNKSEIYTIVQNNTVFSPTLNNEELTLNSSAPYWVYLII